MEEGSMVFYMDNGNIYSGRAVDIEYSNTGFMFSIDSYGDCSGQYRIASSQIGRTVFLSEEEAVEAIRHMERH